jgi:hypothetical protein
MKRASARAATAMAGNKGGGQQRGQRWQGNGNCNNDCRQVDCNGNKEGNGDSNKGGRQATMMAMATTRAMATATRMAGNKEGNGDGGKSNCNGDEGGGQSN